MSNERRQGETQTEYEARLDKEKRAAGGRPDDSTAPEGEPVPTDAEAGETYEGEETDTGEEVDEEDEPAPENPDDETEQEREEREERNRERRKSRGAKCRYCGAALEIPRERDSEGATEHEQGKRAACETCGTIEGERFPPGHPKGHPVGETESGGLESPWAQDPPPPGSIADVYANPPESRAEHVAVRAAAQRKAANEGRDPYKAPGDPTQLPADAPMGQGELGPDGRPRGSHEGQAARERDGRAGRGEHDPRNPAQGHQPGRPTGTPGGPWGPGQPGYVPTSPAARPAPGTPKPGQTPKPGTPRPGTPPRPTQRPAPKPGTGPAHPGTTTGKPGSGSQKLPPGWSGGGSR